MTDHITKPRKQVGRPRIPAQQRQKSINISVDEILRAEVEAYADEHSLSVSEAWRLGAKLLLSKTG